MRSTRISPSPRTSVSLADRESEESRARKAGRRKSRSSLGLSEYLERKPGQLSAASARGSPWAGRSCVSGVFLMDEPLSNLDAKLRACRCRADIAALQADFGITTVYVTHDQAEAMTLGHRVAVLHDGHLQQCGPPRELCERPANVFVAGLPGSPAMNLCTVPVSNGAASVRRRGRYATAGASSPTGERARDRSPARSRSTSRRTAFRRQVDVVEDVGADAFVFCSTELRGDDEARSALRVAEGAKAGRPRDLAAAGRRGAPLRPGERRAAGTLMSAATGPARVRASCSSARSESSLRRSLRLLEQEAEFDAVTKAMRERRPSVVRLVGHGSSDAAASYGVYAFGLLPGWTAMRDSISLTVYYDAKLDLLGLGRASRSRSRARHLTSSST